MAGDWKTLSVSLRIDGQQFEAQLNAAGSGLQSFEQKARSAGSGVGQGLSEAEGHASKLGSTVAQSIGTFVGFTSAQAVISGVSRAFHETVGALVEFDSNMRNVNSIAGLSEGALGNLSHQVIEMSKAFPQSANDIAKGLYDLTSSGFGPANGGLQVLNASLTYASAGLTTTSTAVKGVTSVLNAYGLQASDSAHVSNVLFGAVNKGVITADELAGSIGDVVGIASAAHVPIQDVASALATMTLSGVSASESSTSLNRVIQAFIKPSTEMTTVLHQLGYASGAQALETDGLRGVMEKLRGATGGNVTTLMALFQEVRGARGAFALMANEGKNYADVSQYMTTVDRDQGAAKQALNEQMKSLSAQGKLAYNTLQAGALELGQQALPSLIAGLDSLGKAGAAVWPLLVAGGDAAAPVLGSLVNAFVSLATGAVDVGRALAPVAGLLAGLAFGAALVALQGLASALGMVGGLLQDHAGLVATAVAAYAGFKAVGFASTALNTVQSALLAMKSTLAGAVMDFQQYRSMGMSTFDSIKESAGGMSSLTKGAIAGGIGLGILVAGFMSAQSAAEAGAKQVKEFVSSLKIDPASIQSLTTGLDQLEAKRASLTRAANDANVFKVGWSEVLAMPSLDFNKMFQTKGASDQAGKEIDDLKAKISTARTNITEVAQQTGLSFAQVSERAKAMGLDITVAWGAGNADRQKLVGALDALKRGLAEVGISQKQAMTMDPAEMQAAIDQWTKYRDGVTSAMQKTMDVISGTKGQLGQNLAANGDAIGKWYSTTIASTNEFAANINKAIQAGYDPGLISRVLQAGPAEAGPFLASLVANQSSTYVKMVNDAEKAISELQAKVIAQARLVNLAQNSRNDDMVRQLSLASNIQLRISAEPQIDMARLSAALGRSELDIRNAAGLFGIALPVQPKVMPGTPPPAIPPPPAVPVVVDLRDVQRGLDTAYQGFARYAAQNPSTAVWLNSADPEARLQAARILFDQYRTSHPKTTAWLDALPAEQQMQITNQILQTIARRPLDFQPGVNGGAAQVAEDILNGISAIGPRRRASVSMLPARLRVSSTTLPALGARRRPSVSTAPSRPRAYSTTLRALGARRRPSVSMPPTRPKAS